VLTVTADNKTKILNGPLPTFTASYSGFKYSEALTTSGVSGSPSLTTTAITTSPVGSYTITAALGSLSAGNYSFSFVNGNLSITYALAGGFCLGDAVHAILQPVNADGTSVFKQGSTVPVKFRVCDANGVPIGTGGVVSSFWLVRMVYGTVVTNVNEATVSTTPDASFRWDATSQQWVFNLSTKTLKVSTTYVYDITLDDGSHIGFQFGLK